MTTLNLLSAGAALGLVKALQDRFTAETGATLNARFGAVGAMREAFFAGEPCDVILLTEAMIVALGEGGHADAAARAPLGRVSTRPRRCGPPCGPPTACTSPTPRRPLPASTSRT